MFSFPVELVAGTTGLGVEGRPDWIVGLVGAGVDSDMEVVGIS